MSACAACRVCASLAFMAHGYTLGGRVYFVAHKAPAGESVLCCCSACDGPCNDYSQHVQRHVRLCGVLGNLANPVSDQARCAESLHPLSLITGRDVGSVVSCPCCAGTVPAGGAAARA